MAASAGASLVKKNSLAVPSLVAGALVCLFSVAACTDTNPDQEPTARPAQEDVPFRQDGTLAFLRAGEPFATVAIEIADNDSSRTRGLMQRSSLDDGTGMLFIFPATDYQSFWMANTQVSLDIIFVASDSTVVDIHKYTRPLSSDNVGGSELSRFVVELPAGYVDTHGIVEGDRVRW